MTNNPFSHNLNCDLKNMEALLDKFFNGIAVLDPNKRIIFCNSSFEEIFKVNRNTILNSQFEKVINNESLQLQIINEKEYFEGEIHIGKKYLECRRAAFHYNNYDTGTILIFSDITMKRDTECQLTNLKESIEMIEELFDNAYHGMVLVDKDGRIVKWNYEKLLGIKEEDVLNKYVEDIIENTRLHIVAKTGEKELGEIQKIQGHDMITSRIPIMKNGKIIGAAGTVIFKDVKELKSLVQKLEILKSTVYKYKGEINKFYEAKYSLDDIITQNKHMIYLKEIARRAAVGNSTILIQGESGTGKEFFAHAIHNASLRKYAGFVTINCAAIPKELLETELFGYEGGAFTGAKKEGKMGKVELANGGTILLDEIGCMPAAMQAKLLRVLESHELERVGGTNQIDIDVRVIASTNEKLEQAVQEGRFRLDLYYRLNVVKIEIPPLRERLDDIFLLSQSILAAIEKDLNMSPKRLDETAKNIFLKHDWQGNVRELRNVLERALNVVQGDVIRPEHLPEYLLEKVGITYIEKEEPKLLKEIVAKAEIEAIIMALKEANGNRTLAANQLGIHRTALYKKLQAYGLELSQIITCQ